MNGFNKTLLSIEQAQQLFFNDSKTRSQTINKQELSFQQILENEKEKNSNVVFSKHANNRLESRNISLSEEQVDRLNEGVEKAREKSIKESLVMLDNLAFIVNISNNTVVTAMEQGGNDSNIFTNIDGAVIV